MNRVTGLVRSKSSAKSAGVTGGGQASAPGATAQEGTAQEDTAPDSTVPFPPYTPSGTVAPLTPAAPIAGLDASQAGLTVPPPPRRLAVPGTQASLAERGMTGFRGHRQLRRATSSVLSPFADLAGDPRLPVWIRRGAACTMVGAALTVLVNWPLGIAAAVLVVITDSLYRSRTSAAIPPAVRAASAQRRTRRRLARLASSGYLSLHARAIPGTDSVIDHLVVGPAGIYAVDSEVWDRRLPLRATRGGKLFHGPVDQEARLDHARWEAAEASRLLSAAIGQPVTVRPAMVIYGPTVPWIVVKLNGVDVFCGGRLRRYLRRQAYANRAKCLDERQAEAVHAIAAQVLPPAC